VAAIVVDDCARSSIVVSKLFATFCTWLSHSVHDRYIMYMECEWWAFASSVPNPYCRGPRKRPGKRVYAIRGQHEGTHVHSADISAAGRDTALTMTGEPAAAGKEMVPEADTHRHLSAHPEQPGGLAVNEPPLFAVTTIEPVPTFKAWPILPLAAQLEQIRGAYQLCQDKSTVQGQTICVKSCMGPV